MSYRVGSEELQERYFTWRGAMLHEASRSLGFEPEQLDTSTFELDSVHKFHILLSGMTGLLHTRFRGEARHHKNPCLPIIARDENRGHDIDYELSEIRNFRGNYQERLKLDHLPEFDLTWWMLAQHYSRFKTRLLDITRNPQIALFFACEKYPDQDGYVYVFHSTNKTAIELASQYSGYEDHIRDIDNYYQHNDHVYLRPNIALDRINRQEAEFLWVKNYEDLREKGLYETYQIIPILIKKENKTKLLKELKDPHHISWDFLTGRT